MIEKPEQNETGSSVNAVENNNRTAPDASAVELIEVTSDELNQVEGGNFVGVNHLKIVNDGVGNIGGRSATSGIPIFHK